MRKLSKPTEVPKDVFLLCVSGETDPNLKARLTSVTPHIEAAAIAYEAAVAAVALHTIPVSVGVTNAVTKDEMTALYTDRMVGRKSPGRPVYDRLILRARHGLCALCGAQKAKTLDHHLPKAKFSPLAVNPLNLIPSCRDCNTGKHAALPKTPGDQTFHPYFDDFGADRWLHAEVVQTSPPTISFSVKPPATWPQLWADRAQSHFAAFALGSLYTSLAGQELVNIRYRLMGLFTSTQAQGVSAHLAEEAVSRELADKNSWQTAMYRATSMDTWFCTEGFALIS